MSATLDRHRKTPADFGRERAGWTLGRVASVLTGGLLALCSLGLIGGGGYLLSVATSNGGWLALGHATYQTDGYAESTVTQPSLPWIAGGLLAGAVALGVGAALLIVKPLRRVGGRATSPAQPTW
jgi:hypothetical protein